MMKKLVCLLVLATSVVQAQYSIKGTMTPPEKSDWVMLHKLQGVKPKYITNTTIKFDTISVGADKQILGKFSFELPNNAEPGAYRVTYRNKGAGFVDFIFNKENIEFIFNPKYPEESIVYTSSRENKVFNEYNEAYENLQKQIDAQQLEYLKNPSKDVKKAYKKLVSQQEDLQESYENKSEGMLAYNFIKASQRYNSSGVIDEMPEYLEATVDNFFKYVDFDDEVLYNSSFLVDRVNDFVFYLNFSDDQVTQQGLHKKSIDKVMDVISNKKVKKEILEFLIITFTDKRNSEIVDWLFSEYYDDLSNADAEFKKKKLDELLVSVGRVAPDFNWKEGDQEYSLSGLNDGDYYLMIFWSTTCPHCVKEVPEVHSFSKGIDKLSVISFAMEENDKNFPAFAKRLDGWHNIMGTHADGPLEHPVIKTYKIDATPTYFVLDKDKKIIGVPNKIEDLKKFIENLGKEEEK
ncbi:conserved exported hypothetical protein [Tenacibaculum litopenaei]|uniref:TlpA family protein disulfide reductase n=1 Tax=Tenacibaculum litopenaei TaxID=396016 RepID=UPI00389374AC